MTKEWHEQAACQGMDTNIWFRNDNRQALKVCQSCPVRWECLEDAMREESAPYCHTFGIRGGTTAAQRLAMARGAKVVLDRKCAWCGQPFIPYQQRATLCSKVCQGASWHSKERAAASGS